MKYLIFIFLAFVVACQQEKAQPKFTLPTDKEIEDVIEAVIEQDTLPLFRRDEKEFTYKPKKNEVIINVRSDLNLYLRKNYFYVRDLEYRKDDVPPPSTDNPGDIEYYNLLKESNGLFSKQDSLYLYYQSAKQKTFILPSSLQHKYSIVEFNPNKFNNSNKRGYFDFALPIFSVNKNTAYIAFAYRQKYYGFGGYARYAVLEKINGNWMIKKKNYIWLS